MQVTNFPDISTLGLAKEQGQNLGLAANKGSQVTMATCTSTQYYSLPDKEILDNQSSMSYDEDTDVLYLINSDRPPNDKDNLNSASHEGLSTPTFETESTKSPPNQTCSGLFPIETQFDDYQDLNMNCDDICNDLSLNQLIQNYDSNSGFEDQFDKVNSYFSACNENDFLNDIQELEKELEGLERNDYSSHPLMDKNDIYAAALSELQNLATSSSYLAPELPTEPTCSGLQGQAPPPNTLTLSFPPPQEPLPTPPAPSLSVPHQDNLHTSFSKPDNLNVMSVSKQSKVDQISSSSNANSTQWENVYLLVPTKILVVKKHQSCNSSTFANSDPIKDSTLPSHPKTTRPKRSSKKPLRFNDFQSSPCDNEKEDQLSSSKQVSEAEKFRRMRQINNIASKKCREKKKMKLKTIEDDLRKERNLHDQLKNTLKELKSQRNLWREFVDTTFKS